MKMEELTPKGLQGLGFRVYGLGFRVLKPKPQGFAGEFYATIERITY